MPDFFIFRFFITILIYCIIYNYKSLSLLFMVILLILVDDLDSIFLRIKNKKFLYNFDINYHKYDKINDSLSYILLLPLLYYKVPHDIFKLLSITSLYRLYAVYNYYYYENNTIFIKIPDLFKEILLVEYLSQNYKILNDNKTTILIITTILKTGFEYWHHIIKDKIKKKYLKKID